AEPSRVRCRCDLEKVLVQGSLATGPQHALKRTRPREENVAVLYDIVRIEIGACSIGPSCVARAELSNLHYRQPAVAYRRILLEGQTVEEARDLIEALDLPALRNLAEFGVDEAGGEEVGEGLGEAGAAAFGLGA